MKATLIGLRFVAVGLTVPTPSIWSAARVVHGPLATASPSPHAGRTEGPIRVHRAGDDVRWRIAVPRGQVAVFFEVVIVSLKRPQTWGGGRGAFRGGGPLDETMARPGQRGFPWAQHRDGWRSKRPAWSAQRIGWH